MPEWSLTVLGEVTAKGRARSRLVQPKGRKAFISHYTPEPTRRYEDIVRQRAAIAWPGTSFLASDVPLEMTVRVFRTVPASWSLRKRFRAYSGEIRPVSVPDMDNLVKSIKDALQGVVFAKDSAVVDLHASKRYAAEPRVEVHLSW